MAYYVCPLCGKEVERELIVFLSHADEHVIEVIKKKNPQWVASDGSCQVCLEYYKRQMAGEVTEENLGPSEVRKRRVLSIVLILASSFIGIVLFLTHVPRACRLSLFPLLFGAIFCWIEAEKRTCSILAEQGFRNMDEGPLKIEDVDLAAQLRRRGRGIVMQSILLAALATVLVSLIP